MSEGTYPLKKKLLAIDVVADMLKGIRIPLAEVLESEAAEFAAAAEVKEKDSAYEIPRELAQWYRTVSTEFCKKAERLRTIGPTEDMCHF